MKILDDSCCREEEKGNLGLYLSNSDMLLNSGRPVVIRIPVIGGYTDDMENRKAVRNLMERYRRKILKIELIKEHNLGEEKYRSLGMPLPRYVDVDDWQMEKYRSELSGLHVPVEICRI